MKTVMKIQADASKIGELIDIMNCIEAAGVADIVDSVDLTRHEATIVGQGLDSIKFHLGSYGYEMSIGPNKTHLFVTLTNKKKGK